MAIGNKKSLQCAHAYDSKRLFAKSTVAGRPRIVFQSVAEQPLVRETDIGGPVRQGIDMGNNRCERESARRDCAFFAQAGQPQGI